MLRKLEINRGRTLVVDHSRRMIEEKKKIIDECSISTSSRGPTDLELPVREIELDPLRDDAYHSSVKVSPLHSIKYSLSSNTDGDRTIGRASQAEKDDCIDASKRFKKVP